MEQIEKLIRQRGRDVESPTEIAAFYEVYSESYIAGQKWANDHPGFFEDRIPGQKVVSWNLRIYKIATIVLAIIIAFYLGSLNWDRFVD